MDGIQRAWMSLCSAIYFHLFQRFAVSFYIQDCRSTLRHKVQRSMWMSIRSLFCVFPYSKFDVGVFATWTLDVRCSFFCFIVQCSMSESSLTSMFISLIFTHPQKSVLSVPPAQPQKNRKGSSLLLALIHRSGSVLFRPGQIIADTATFAGILA